MVVLRDESCVPNENGTVSTDTSNIMDSFDVELMKKPGKGLGLSIVGRKSGSGIFISDIVSVGITLERRSGINNFFFKFSGSGRRGGRGRPFNERRSDFSCKWPRRAERVARRSSRCAENDDGQSDVKNGSSQGTLVHIQFRQVSVENRCRALHSLYKYFSSSCLHSYFNGSHRDTIYISFFMLIFGKLA